MVARLPKGWAGEEPVRPRASVPASARPRLYRSGDRPCRLREGLPCSSSPPLALLFRDGNHSHRKTVLIQPARELPHPIRGTGRPRQRPRFLARARRFRKAVFLVLLHTGPRVSERTGLGFDIPTIPI